MITINAILNLILEAGLPSIQIHVTKHISDSFDQVGLTRAVLTYYHGRERVSTEIDIYTI
jgi:hypothetical protein